MPITTPAPDAEFDKAFDNAIFAAQLAMADGAYDTVISTPYGSMLPSEILGVSNLADSSVAALRAEKRRFDNRCLLADLVAEGELS